VASGISRDDYISDEVHEDQIQFAVGDYTRRFAEATYKPCNPLIADCWLLSCAKGLVMILTFVRVMPLTFLEHSNDSTFRLLEASGHKKKGQVSIGSCYDKSPEVSAPCRAVGSPRMFLQERPIRYTTANNGGTFLLPQTQ
jgi:hypothetical protein